jgi:hypothetical protein
MKKNILANLPRIVALMSVAAVFVMAYGQTASCVTTFPQCDPTVSVLNGTDCGSGGVWSVGSVVPFTMYSCSNWYSGCGGSPGSGICNVMVEFSGYGRDISCSSSGQHYFCLTGTPVCVGNLNKNCAGGDCSVPGGINDTPTGVPPADNSFLDGTNPYAPLPGVPSIPPGP